MHVILTHEHADFDAVASLVGLARLLPDAVPVLPQQVNDNVADFLMLFGRELPLRRRDEIPRTRVAHAWIVDTRKVQAVRGMTAATGRSVIDHHVDAEPTEVDEALLELDVQAVGATATLIAERLANGGHVLTEVEASLLLLGIYEDTGCLTYSGTTARDLRAAAWLLDCGADLGLRDQFMRHTLSQAAQELYRRLLDSCDTTHIGGHEIIVAATSAPDFDEEIAAIATKMVDLLEPSALFVLVDVGGHVQLVARRTSNDVDVGAVAEALGGGGHPRAAAAVIRDMDLATAAGAVVEQLPYAVKEVTRVADIMSYGPVVSLAPDQTVGEAVLFTRQYGHEGYPVVDGDTVLGVLTRRDLDRATHHHMTGVPVRQLLTGTPPAVSPSDSVETLQHLMMDRDVGQVPVTEGGLVVGIVTRTDVLKLWADRLSADRRRRQQRTSVRSALRSALAPDQLGAIAHIAETAEARGERAYLVGGLPRDMVLSREPGPDIDVVVVGDAQALGKAVAERHGGRVTAHRRFGTAKWIREGIAIDLSSARTEYYREPTALPSVARGSLRSDLRRRDFTINTLAVDLGAHRFGRIIDMFHGLADLENRSIRVLHSLSFIEDPTRILRAVRFETRLGFQMDARTTELIPDALPLLDRVSGARLRNEMLQLFDEPDPAAALTRLESLGTLRAMHGGLTAGPLAAARLDALPPAWAFWCRVAAARPLPERPHAVHRMIVWLAEHGDVGIAAARRFRLRRRDIEILQAVARLTRPDDVLGNASAPASHVYRALEHERPEALVLAWLTSSDRGTRYNLRRFVTRLAGTRSDIGGADLTDLGLPPGPAYGRVLRAVLDARLDGHVSSRGDEMALATRLVAAEQRQAPAVS